MNRRSGFTIIELVLTIGLVALLVTSMGIVYLTCLKAFSASDDRSRVRSSLAQAMELISSDLRAAQGAPAACNATTMTFSTGSTITYELSGTNLLRNGVVKARNIKVASTTLCSYSSSLFTVDVTASDNGVNIQLRTVVKGRNI